MFTEKLLKKFYFFYKINNENHIYLILKKL